MSSPLNTLDDFYAGADPYVQLLDTFAKKHQLVGRAQADHICYRCDSQAVFESIRSLFENGDGYIFQSIISKRRIAVIRLPRPIETALGRIDFLELSDQKPDGSQTNRYDHIEAYPIDWSYNAMVKYLAQSETIIEVVRPHHSTHDIDIGGGFLFRCTREPLVEQIKREEMQ